MKYSPLKFTWSFNWFWKKNSCKCPSKIIYFFDLLYHLSLCQSSEHLGICLEHGWVPSPELLFWKENQVLTASPHQKPASSQIPGCLIIALHALRRHSLLKTGLMHNRVLSIDAHLSSATRKNPCKSLPAKDPNNATVHTGTQNTQILPRCRKRTPKTSGELLRFM